MFKYIVTAAVALIATPAFGADQPKGYPGICGEIGDTAEGMLAFRYQGVSLSKLVAIINKDVDPRYQELFRSIVVDAFRRPLFSTPEYIEQDKREFRSQWELACYEAGLETI